MKVHGDSSAEGEEIVFKRFVYSFGIIQGPCLTLSELKTTLRTLGFMICCETSPFTVSVC